jgi:hypothetical protein
MVAEVRCVNCSRHLADVVVGERGLPRLGPPSGQATTPILVVRSGRSLRCVRCGGRAMVEQLLGVEAAAAQSARADERLTSAA